MANPLTPVNLGPGSAVWIEDSKEAWAEGFILDIKGDKAEVRKSNDSGSTIWISLSKLQPKDQDAPNGGIDDMTKLAYLHEPGVLHNLDVRYSLDEIYTYTGSILIAVNPFMKLPHLYDVPMMEQYKGARLGELSPHVFAIAEAAFRAMVEQGNSQSILVSGESGAGKTETTKLIMQYVAYMGGRAEEDGRSVEQQVLESNPLLEAFGNAKTVRNNNSSRFGKFVEIQFDKSNRISGAAVRTYLLERSRVVQISDPERNYHCFYQLCAGASKEEMELYKLGPPESFHYLNQSSCMEIPGKDSNASEYVKTKRAMSVVGVSPEEQEVIFRIVAAILHLGNVRFAPGSEPDSSAFADEKSEFHLRTCAELLRCDGDQLYLVLRTRTMRTRDEVILKSLDTAAATVSRDTLAKTIYSKLFDWLVEKVNKSIGQDPTSKKLVGVLDIYGFESFEQNSFEQFCINLANEKLQQHFNHHVFKAEQEEYTKEEINWSYIDFVDNQDVLELIEKKPQGIIAMLDEQCMFPKATHETFASKLYQNLGNHKRFSKPKVSRTDFIVEHYAGKVVYQTNLFLEKNKDYVIVEHQDLLFASEDPFVSALFRPPPGLDKAKTKFTSLGSSFKLQLQALMETLNTTEPHYIRCVKPNSLNRPGLFESKNVLHQLRCGGVLEAVRISCAGYPTRRTFYDFLDRFALLEKGVLDIEDERNAVETILTNGGLRNYQIGKSKVFLRAGQMAELDAKRQEKLNNAAQTIQRCLRAFLQWRAYSRLKKLVVRVQAKWRGQLARKKYVSLRQRAAAVKVQKHVRRWLCQMRIKRDERAALRLQTYVRAMAARASFENLRKNVAVVVIQSMWRQYSALKDYLRLQRAAIVFQCAWRCRSARRVLKQLKLEARQMGNLQEAKTKLEKECEELTWRLQLEKRMRTDLEESKSNEIARLQAALDEAMAHVGKLEVDLSEEKSLREKEAEERAEEKPLQNHVISEKSVLASMAPDGALADALEQIKELTLENTRLKSLLDVLDSRAAEAEDKAQADSQIRLKYDDLLDKFKESQDALAKAEELVKNLEQEYQILRQNSALTPPRSMVSGRMSVSGASYFQKSGVGKVDAGLMSPSVSTERFIPDSPTDSSDNHQNDTEMKSQRTLIERQQTDQEVLLQCLSVNIGFSNQRPSAALIVYRSLLHWRSFEADRTNVFDRIIQTVSTAVENQDSLDVLSYWLSNTSTLLHLLQRTLKASGSAGAPATQASHHGTRARKSQQQSFFGRMSLSQTFKSPSHSTVAKEAEQSFFLRHVEAKYPALLFKQQLTAYVEKIFGIIRDTVKRDITPTLGSCIQAPRMPRSTSSRQTVNRGGAQQGQVLSSQWTLIITTLTSLLGIVKANCVPTFLVRKLMTQLFAYINVQLFNSLLLRRECCSFSNGEYVKAGLSELENWILECGTEYAGSSLDELRFIRQAIGFLVIHQKPKKGLEEITHFLCPVLSIQQLYRLSTMYWDDKYGTLSVAPEVIAEMRRKMTDDANSSSNSFLLDDDSSIPFSVDEFGKLMPEVDLAEIDVPASLQDNISFAFLKSRFDV